MYCLKCGAQMAENATICPVCGATQTNAQQPSVDNTPMKWFKFLIYFSLFAGAVLNALSGIGMLTGSAYGADAALVYSTFGGLKTLDVAMGVASIALAVFGIYTRFRLSGFYKNGPTMLMLTYVGSAVIQLGYLIGTYVVLPGEVTAQIGMSSYISGIVTSVAMIFINKVYFDKRAHLFTKE